MKPERRCFTLDGLTVEDRDGLPPVIRGHAAVFDKWSSDLGGFRERILPGAFSEAILGDDVRALFNHDANLVLGRNRAGTLRMAEDGEGLAVEIDLPDTQYARDLRVSMQRGDITQMSFGFTVSKGGQSWGKGTDGLSERTLTKVRLFDVSPVTYPAYSQTDAAVRELSEIRQTEEAAESAARRARMRLAEGRLTLAERKR